MYPPLHPADRFLSFDDHPDDDAAPPYREHLETMIVDRLISAARRGWTPDDLLHVVGRQVGPFLPVVLRQILAVAPGRVGAAWQRQTPAARRRRKRPHLPVIDLEPLLESLLTLPTLSDAELFRDLAHLRSSVASDPHLSADQQRAAQRISGLLKKAGSTTFPAEAEALVAKAQQLRQHYRIENAVLDEPDDPDGAVSTRIHLHAPWVRFQHLLLSHVALANSCRAVLTVDVNIASVVGHPDDVRHTAELFLSLNRQRDYFMRNSPGAQEAAQKGQTSAYRRSFLLSYAQRVGDLLTQAGEDVSDTAAGTADVLPALARRDETAVETCDRLFPRTTGSHFRHGSHAPGAADGIRAAERSHLGPERNAVNSA